jgi:xanthine dehydrogenase small subunit
VRLSEAAAPLAAIDPDLGELMRRFGSVQVRTAGTVGGNIANGSPIGDLAPAFIALGATLRLQGPNGARDLPLERFFIAYGKQDRARDELVAAVTVPKLAADEHFRCLKLTKRFDEDISAVMAALKITLSGRTIAAARLAFGGMAATPKRASDAEGALVGASIDDPAAWEPAVEVLAADFQPISDMRASASYRLDGARALLRKMLVEIAGGSSAKTRLVGLRPESAEARP